MLLLIIRFDYAKFLFIFSFALSIFFFFRQLYQMRMMWTGILMSVLSV